MGQVAATLAGISGLAYEADPTAGLAALGFQTLDFTSLKMHDGVFVNQNAAATVATGELGGQNVLVLAFRGSDDATDWKHDFQDINADYTKFTRLFSAVDNYAAAHDMKVVVTGFSLGGGLAQDYMAHHADHGEFSYQAVTFGSPGALIPAGADSRIVNYEIGADPIVFAGLHRQEIALAVKLDPTHQLHDALVAKIQDAGIPLTVQQIDTALNLSLLEGDYHNRGATVLLGAGPPISSLGDLLNANVGVHDIDLYGALAAQATDPVITPPGLGGPSSHTGLETFIADHAAQIATVGSSTWGAVDGLL
jgi:hypothetical protein